MENKDNIAWFFIKCINAKINSTDVAVMCDRGNFQVAVKLVWIRTGISVQICFCKIHILRNVKRNFGCSGREFENAVWNLQFTEIETEYNEALTAIRSNYGDGEATYLKYIDPIYWTVFANMPMGTGNHVESTISSRIESDNNHRFTRNLCYENEMPPTTPCPLFEWRTSKKVSTIPSSSMVFVMQDL